MKLTEIPHTPLGFNHGWGDITAHVTDTLIKDLEIELGYTLARITTDTLWGEPLDTPNNWASNPAAPFALKEGTPTPLPPIFVIESLLGAYLVQTRGFSSITKITEITDTSSPVK